VKRAWRQRLRHFGAIGGLALLTACGGGSRSISYDRYYRANHAYPVPGPPDDPWGPYIQNASSRFSIPSSWIHAVIHQESGGHEYRNGHPITSGAGAMGLMQLMPATYAEMQARFSLGADPYDPRNNIMAGTGYIGILYAKYGAPAFLAAYNAGPTRLDDYLSTGRSLPNETVNYVAAITPNLGNDRPLTGPLSAYATTDQLNTRSQQGAYASAAPSSGNWRDAAYEPPQSQDVQSPEEQEASATAAAAYAPSNERPSQPDTAPPLSQPAPIAPPQPYPGSATETTYAPPPSTQYAPAGAVVTAQRAQPAPVDVSSYGAWAIQVGAFTSEGQARFANTIARQADFADLKGAQNLVEPVSSRGRLLYRARLTGLSRSAASNACAAMTRQGLGCIVTPP